MTLLQLKSLISNSNLDQNVTAIASRSECENGYHLAVKIGQIDAVVSSKREIKRLFKNERTLILEAGKAGIYSVTFNCKVM